VIALRSICASQLDSMGIQRYQVTDTIPGLLPACTGISEYSMTYRLIEASDGVHLTAEGYCRLASLITKYCENQNTAGASHLSGPRGQPTKGSGTSPNSSYFWRGFTSPVGTPRPKNSTARYHLTHGGGKVKAPGANSQAKKFTHPYRGAHGGGRRGR